jgi:hypothetical protein
MAMRGEIIAAGFPFVGVTETRLRGNLKCPPQFYSTFETIFILEMCGGSIDPAVTKTSGFTTKTITPRY